MFGCEWRGVYFCWYYLWVFLMILKIGWLVSFLWFFWWWIGDRWICLILGCGYSLLEWFVFLIRLCFCVGFIGFCCLVMVWLLLVGCFELWWRFLECDFFVKLWCSWVKLVWVLGVCFVNLVFFFVNCWLGMGVMVFWELGNIGFLRCKLWGFWKVWIGYWGCWVVWFGNGRLCGLF